MKLGHNVVILGAAGGIVHPLSLLLKSLSSSLMPSSPFCLYDLATMGKSVDLAHKSTNTN